MKHPLETTRNYVPIEQACIIVDRDRRTLYRWKDAGWVRTEKTRARRYFNVEDLTATEAAIANGEEPKVHAIQH